MAPQGSHSPTGMAIRRLPAGHAPYPNPEGPMHSGAACSPPASLCGVYGCPQHVGGAWSLTLAPRPRGAAQYLEARLVFNTSRTLVLALL